MYIRNLKQTGNYRLVLKKVHRVIKLNQNTWLKMLISRLRKATSIGLEIDFFKLINNSVLEKILGNVQKLRDIKNQIIIPKFCWL